MNSVASPKRALYPVVGLSHLCDDPVALVMHLVPGASAIQLCVALQPNGVPHLGTVTTLMTAFALAERIAAATALPTAIVVDVLENSPYWQSLRRDEAGNTYVLSLEAALLDGRPVVQHYLPRVASIWERASEDTGVAVVSRFYRDFQRDPSVRRALLKAVASADRLGPIVSPADRQLHLRGECPVCRYMPKSPCLTRPRCVGDEVVLEGACPDHGPYTIQLSLRGGGWVDMNAALRDLAKGAMLLEGWTDSSVLPITVSGADWSGMWPLRLFAEGMAALELPYRGIPQRFYAPTIMDWSGAKFSKTLYVAEGAYRGEEGPFVDVDRFCERYGEEGLRLLWGEVREWAQSNARLMRSYSVDYFRKLLESKGCV